MKRLLLLGGTHNYRYKNQLNKSLTGWEIITMSLEKAVNLKETFVYILVLDTSLVVKGVKLSQDNSKAVIERLDKVCSHNGMMGLYITLNPKLSVVYTNSLEVCNIKNKKYNAKEIENLLAIKGVI